MSDFNTIICLIFKAIVCLLSRINNSFPHYSPNYLIFAFVKGIALILALIIFSTSLKASAFFSGAAKAINGGNSSSMSCCKKSVDSTTKECSDSEDDQEESGCCEGGDCSCTCCLHITYLLQFSHDSVSINDFSEVKFGYSFLYQDDYLTSVFHPPSFV